MRVYKFKKDFAGNKKGGLYRLNPSVGANLVNRGIADLANEKEDDQFFSDRKEKQRAAEKEHKKVIDAKRKEAEEAEVLAAIEAEEAEKKD